jgi:hypothetical protein
LTGPSVLGEHNLKAARPCFSQGCVGLSFLLLNTNVVGAGAAAVRVTVWGQLSQGLMKILPSAGHTCAYGSLTFLAMFWGKKGSHGSF